MENSLPKQSYNAHALEVLEFGRVREIAASLADSCEGRALLLEAFPYTEAEPPRRLLAEAGEMMDALRFDEPTPGLTLHPVKELFPRLKVQGTVLSIEDMTAIADNLECAHEVKRYFAERSARYPVIAGISAMITEHRDLVRHIRRVITPDKTIADDATPELKAIRRRLLETRGRLRTAIDAILSKLPDEVVGERTVTIRDGRYVIPVRETMKRSVPGAVHDRSQTGRTLFIEPLETIEANNQVRELELAELEEIFRILLDLTGRIAVVVHEIESNYMLTARLDAIKARARYGVHTIGVVPDINDESVIRIKSGRHPLLDWKFRKSGGCAIVVPLTIEIEPSVRTVVITGPNAGGKTVAIKTVGLLTLMALSGFPIPASEGTSVCAPAGVFADIGDEQSIEDDLSTFSSHMRHMVTILNEAVPGTLVLLDELGGSTNPADGESIALAILRRLNGIGAQTLATTHHDGLKVFAHETEGAVNASMEFDNVHLRPTFALRMGIPGSSYAFEIASRIGFPNDVLKEAETLAGSGKKSLEGLITELEEHVRQADMERKTALSERMEMEQMKQNYERQLDEIKAKKREMLSEALDESRKLIENTNRQIESIIKSIRETKASHEAIVKAKEIVKETAADLQERADRISAPKPKMAGKPVEKLEKGLHVYAENLGAVGIVEEVLDNGGKARIRVGGSKATVVVNKQSLSLCEAPQKLKETKVTVRVETSQAVTNEIDVRGMVFDEARDAIDHFFDTLRSSGLDTAHIIHGKGTGALRNKITQYLRKHENVQSFRLGNWNEGSYGVTVVTLKK